VRHPKFPLATSMCLAILVTLAGSPSAAFGVATRQSAILPGFHAQSLSFVSPKHGWMLGSAPCGQAVCTTVVGTNDGGLTWHERGTVDAPLTLDDVTGVTQIRFADALHGWAFDPAVYATADGGATWQKQRTSGGRPLVALAGDAEAVYAVVSACHLGEPISHCSHPTTLWRTTPTQGSWTPVSLTLPVTNQAMLAVHGLAAYLIVPVGSSDPDVLDATVDGQQWTSRPDPCVKSHNNETLTGVAPISDTEVALLCVGRAGRSEADKRVLRSNDTGQTTSPAGTTPSPGITSQLVAAPNGTLAVASYSAASWIYRNAGGQNWTTPVTEADGGEGWNDIVFTTNQVGFVIHGPATCCGGHGPGDLWQTEDGGLTWQPV
jgi:photosystem II stability/assembly factor-like uncharacterized protein